MQFLLILVSLLLVVCARAEIKIESVSRDGTLAVSGAFTNGVCTIDKRSSLDMDVAWVPLQNAFTTNGSALFHVSTNDSAFYRAVGFDLSPGREGFTNLTQVYSLLTTVAGAGGIGTDGVNKWQAEFEGGPATNALLSRPHIACGDAAGNIYIADKDGHAIRKVLTNGILLTVAGINSAGNGPDELTPATEVALWEPNGLFTRADGTSYILDLQNGKIRRLDTNGMLETLITVPGGIAAGRGLWVNDDETVAFISSLTVVLRWDTTNGVTTYASGFTQLGNLTVDPAGQLVVTDRGRHQVYRVDDLGTSTAIAGNGATFGGGDGQLALETGLNEVRGVWFLPTGAYFLCTHRGSQIWYVDTGGYIHLFVHGARGAHAGDGTYFYNPTEPRVSENRAVTIDFQGNLLITENDSGYIRKVEFLRYSGAL